MKPTMKPMKPTIFPHVSSIHPVFLRQAMPPTLPTFRWPSGAQSLEDYEERLAAMPESVAIKSRGNLELEDGMGLLLLLLLYIYIYIFR